jgi:acetyltransferase-like isoleucine patch superfamily enzyme
MFRSNKIYKNIFNFWLLNFKGILSKKVVFRSKPLCNQKTYLTGYGKIEIGSNCIFGYKFGGGYYKGAIEIQPRFANSLVRIGNDVTTNNNLFVLAGNYIEIGDNTVIGQQVTIMDFEAHGIEIDKRKEMGEIGNVIIGKNVWIGNNVTILKNSEIGDNTIIAAHAVVSGKFPSNVIIGGVPAKFIKNL